MVTKSRISASIYMHIERSGKVHGIVTAGYRDKVDFAVAYMLAKYGTGPFFATSILAHYQGSPETNKLIAEAAEIWSAVGWRPLGVTSGPMKSSLIYGIEIDGSRFVVSNEQHRRKSADQSYWTWHASWDGVNMTMPDEIPLNVARFPIVNGNNINRVYLTNRGVYVGNNVDSIRVVQDVLMASKRIEWADMATINRIKSSITTIMEHH